MADDRAYDWFESYKVDRAGTCYPLFPMDMTADGTYYVWKAETGIGVYITYIEERTVDGVRMLVFGGDAERTTGGHPHTPG